MRVLLKGINKSVKKLADGTIVTYYYAYRGGPRLEGKPGSHAFMASYNRAIEERTKPNEKLLLSVIRAYQNSPAFLSLAPRTKDDYLRCITKIESRYGKYPIRQLATKEATGMFLQWRDELGRTSLRQADYVFTVLKTILSWALRYRLVPANPCVGGGSIYKSERAESVWSVEEESRFLSHANDRVRLAFMLALWTGQRQGDLLALTWAQYDGETIRLKQGKTGTRVEIPIGSELKVLLNATPRIGSNILTRLDGKPIRPTSLRNMWAETAKASGVEERTFHDLRGTAVTRLAVSGCTEAEIAYITGHSMKDVGLILDAHYLRRDPALGRSAIGKREQHEKRTNSQTGLQTGI